MLIPFPLLKDITRQPPVLVPLGFQSGCWGGFPGSPGYAGCTKALVVTVVTVLSANLQVRANLLLYFLVDGEGFEPSGLASKAHPEPIAALVRVRPSPEL